MKNKHSVIIVCSQLLISSLCFAQSNAPSNATQVPSATVTPAAVPTGYSGIGDLNYVRTWSPQQPYKDIAEVMSADRTPAQVLQSTTYLDGMGRPIQNVVKKIGPDAFGKQDAVSPVVYDALGRVAKQYFSYMSSTNDGQLKPDPFTEQKSFYTTTYTSDQPSLRGEMFFYSQAVYETSPLSRVMSTYAPGNSWVGSGRGTTQQFAINSITDSVIIWKVACSNDIGDDKNIPYTTGRYNEASLFKNSTIDEQGKKNITYTNQEGQTILTKVQQDASPSTGHSGWICTYYIYDDLGRLRCIIQPNAVQYMNNNNWTLSSTLLAEQCFRYEYDGRKRMIAKKIPGAAWLYTIYDTRDRVVFTQDGNLRAKNQWTTTLYDAQNRITTTGITTYTGSREELINYVNGLSNTTTSLTIRGSTPTVPTFTNSVTVFNNPVPTTATFIPLTIHYYDDYSFTTNTYDNSHNATLGAGNNAYADSLPNSASNNTYGASTGNKIKLITDATDLTKGSWLTTIYYYDDKGRPTQTQAENYKGGKDIVTTRYNFVGTPVCTYSVHNNPAAGVRNMRIQSNYDYDHAGRLLKITQKLNDNDTTQRTIVEYTYDHLGRAKTKRLGQKRNMDGTLSTQPLDILEYDYNIRGWLTGINATFATSATDNSKYFGMQLSYDWGFQTNQYNGTISGIKWKTKGGGKQQAYGFTYDHTNQLLFADFNQYQSSAWSKTSKSGAVNFSTQIGDGKNASTAYDPNGNIQAMKQWGAQLGNGAMVMDNIQYSYHQNGLSNQLNAVTEDGTIADKNFKLGDFTDGNRTGADYSYDVNGNLLQDKNKNNTTITYTYLDLPATITVKDKGTITYIYDAVGNKIEKKVEDLNTKKTTITSYIGAMQYINDTLKQIAHEEGRLRFSPSSVGGGLDEAIYDYFETDHLGNTRIVLTDEYQKDQYPIATMETANAAIENTFYSNIETTRADRPSGFTAATTGSNNKVAKLKGTTQKIGPGMLLKVMAGDQLSIKVTSWYTAGGASPVGSSSIVNDIIGVLTNQLPSISAGKISSTEINATVLQNPLNAFSDIVSNNTNTLTTKPKAHLNYILLDESELSYIAAGSGCKQVGADKVVTDLSGSLEVPQNGYLYIYTSNETENIEVFFDNLQVTHTRGPLLQESHYYPFGGEIKSLCSKAIKGLSYINNNNKFNGGTELNEDLGLELYETPYRNYNAQIGRFQGIDLLAELTPSITPMQFGANNPISFNDPTGLIVLAAKQAVLSGAMSGIFGSAFPNLDVTETPSSEISYSGGGSSSLGGSYGSSYGSGYSGYYGGGYSGGVLHGGGGSSNNNAAPNIGSIYTEPRGINEAVNRMSMNVFQAPPPDSLPGLDKIFQQFNWVEPTNTFNGSIGALSGLLENFAGKMRMGSNFRMYMPTQTGRVFYGNQYVSTTEATRIGKVAGISTLVIGTIIDAVGVYNYYYKGANDPNAVHPVKAGINLGVGIYSMYSGPPGWFFGTVYFLGDLVPGGWPALMEAGYQNTKNNRAILGPSWSPRPGGGLL